MKMQCPICRKTIRSLEGIRTHARVKHPKHHIWPDGKAVLRRDLDDEPSMADRMIAAQLQRDTGEPVDDDWLLDCI